jgi:hypothetical protein
MRGGNGDMEQVYNYRLLSCSSPVTPSREFAALYLANVHVKCGQFFGLGPALLENNIKTDNREDMCVIMDAIDITKDKIHTCYNHIEASASIRDQLSHWRFLRKIPHILRFTSV